MANCEANDSRSAAERERDGEEGRSARGNKTSARKRGCQPLIPLLPHAPCAMCVSTWYISLWSCGLKMRGMNPFREKGLPTVMPFQHICVPACREMFALISRTGGSVSLSAFSRAGDHVRILFKCNSLPSHHMHARRFLIPDSWHNSFSHSHTHTCRIPYKAPHVLALPMQEHHEGERGGTRENKEKSH